LEPSFGVLIMELALGLVALGLVALIIVAIFLKFF
jgi:hypothetical protein